MRTGVAHSDTENEFLTLTFGPMQRAVESLESHRRRYAASVGVTEALREKLHRTLASAYAMKPAKGDDPADEAVKKYNKQLADNRLGNMRPDSIPRILLTGETGVGKTLIARSLARVQRDDALPYIRVPIPEFAGKEEDFESEMFGYRGGTYTGSPLDGNIGILMKHIGGVVFLDEIGDATPTMQAKLLAYLDDFKVRPRGFLASLFAPTLIIAATNYDLDARVKAGDFRKDLLMRFPVRTHIPSLNERKDWLPLILDTLLQSEKVNPGQTITDIGDGALSQLTQWDYRDGNFRLLENTLTAAVERARRQARPFLVAQDVSS
jgi:DNA-binding NtrC family response regulator